jgi:predicted CXXCH cytochrome family protein
MKRLFFAAVALSVSAAAVTAAELKDRMEFPASQGVVIYFHNNHVNEVKGDCKVCHEGAPGKIAGFGKELAHKLCIGCHEPKDGMPEGPTKCDGCHTR